MSSGCIYHLTDEWLLYQISFSFDKTFPQTLCDLSPSICPAIYILGSIYQAIKAVCWSLHEAKERA